VTGAHFSSAAGRRLRVLQVVTHLDLGGAESIAISLAEELRDRIEPSMFAVLHADGGSVTRSMVARLDAAGATRHEGTALPFKRGGLLQAGFALARVIRSTRPDLVHLHTELPEACWAVASRLSPLVRATPVLRTVHNTRLWPQWRRIGYRVERALGDRPAVAVSDNALEGLAQFRSDAGLPLLPADGARVLLNGVRLAQGQSTRDRSNRQAPCRILFAGRLEPQKGADLLPQIWAAARAGHTVPVELTIMGAGALKQEIAAAFAGDRTVRMVPPAPGLADVLRDHDVLLMPSRFEGLTLVAVEAVMAGLPVIGFQAPGLQDIFPDTYGGLAPPEDVPAIASLLAGAMAAPGSYLDAQTRQWITDRFGLDRMANDYAAVYASLVAGGPIDGTGPA
jgi:glycosyltransferase involved in cell wall biosynthesis